MTDRPLQDYVDEVDSMLPDDMPAFPGLVDPEQLDEFRQKCQDLADAFCMALKPAVELLTQALRSVTDSFSALCRSGIFRPLEDVAVEDYGIARSDIRSIDAELLVVRLWNGRRIDISGGPL